mgnify:CR=1 FL=1
MVMLTPEQAMGGNAEAKMKTRENSIQKSISDAWVFLRDRGIIKTIEPASLGKNAGFLLLLGDDAENAAVERWARECLASDSAMVTGCAIRTVFRPFHDRRFRPQWSNVLVFGQHDDAIQIKQDY